MDEYGRTRDFNGLNIQVTREPTSPILGGGWATLNGEDTGTRTGFAAGLFIAEGGCMAELHCNGGVDIIAGTDLADTIDLSATTVTGIARIEGGAGADEYHVGIGDIIEDPDNQGTIWFDGEQLSILVFKQQSEDGTYYESADNTWRGVINDDGSLNIFHGENAAIFTIKNFATGNFGIDCMPGSASFSGSLRFDCSHVADTLVGKRCNADDYHWRQAA